ncbi:MAG: hypothetical protein HDT33_09310 [Clostridiales bacterium]|nr:hypothetical protein [Clostridiales bacterium]
MKKLLALLLSMVMAVSLAAPAFADGPDGPPAPENLGIIGGADGPTAIIVGTPSGEDFDWWSVGNEWELVCEWYPEYTAVFLEEVEAWYAGHTDWYDASTFDEFVENAGGTEAAYLALFYDWKWEREDELARNKLITSLGGVPGQVGVMVNGQYIQFPDAVPEVVNGRAMAPVRVLVEALGGEVSVYGSDIRCKRDGVTVIFTIGSKEAVVELDGDAEEGCERLAGVLEMDCAPYIKGGRTYVPVRFIGKILGCEVGWDSRHETVVLLDREALAAQFDESFTILNRALANLAYAVEAGENYRADTRGSVTVTAFDTLHGDKTYKADFTGKTLLNAEAVNGAYSVTMSDSTVDALVKQLIGGEGPEYEEDAAILRNTIGNLKNMEIIMNREGLAWVHAPVLDELGGEENLWCGIDMGAELADALFAETGAATVGTVLAAGMGTDSIMDYSSVGALAQMIFDLYGDDKFTTAGGTSTLTIGLDDLEELDPDGTLGIGYDYDSYREYQFTLKVDSRGGVSLSCTAETEAQYGMPAVRAVMDCSLSNRQASISLNYHVANVGEMKLTLNTARQTTSEAPKTEPPEGANIVDSARPLNP